MKTLNILKYFLAIAADPQKIPVNKALNPPCRQILAKVDSLWDDLTKFWAFTIYVVLTYHEMIELANNSMLRHLRTECVTMFEGCHTTFKQTH